MIIDKTAKKQRGKPFPKGVSGNPQGRPKGTLSIVEGIRRQLKKRAPGEDKRTYLDKLIEILFKKAIEDEDIRAITEIMNRVDGKPREVTIYSGSLGNGPVKHIIEVVSEKAKKLTEEIIKGDF
ncbi:MAG: hypothetical protein DDT22_01340 [candidate division WS2 bacterium]|nr:hypothetical protein [Candidatus Lithacetigena glycinireducens]